MRLIVSDRRRTPVLPTLLLAILAILASLPGTAAAQPAPYLVVPHHTGAVSLADPGHRHHA